MLNIQGMSVDRRSKCAWKIDSLRQFIKEQSSFIPVICITESGLKGYMSNSQINIPSYVPYRSDRKTENRGDVLPTSMKPYLLEKNHLLTISTVKLSLPQ